ncbi:hypothetical protein ACFQ1L_35150 [Phytohabitans flavus]|uniref:hypothetical protein n=1 Tax=Phytohabitans flavus TaxID=1076124 RepID=UPI0036299DD9
MVVPESRAVVPAPLGARCLSGPRGGRRGWITVFGDLGAGGQERRVRPQAGTQCGRGAGGPLVPGPVGELTEPAGGPEAGRQGQVESGGGVGRRAGVEKLVGERGRLLLRWACSSTDTTS